MKTCIFTKILILHLFFLVFTPVCFAQNAPETAPNGQNTEIMGEDDRLPFMQNEPSAAANEPGSGGLLLKTLGAMLLIVGLIFGGAWGAKKLGLGNFSAKNAETDIDLSILTSVSLGNGRTISTVRFGERVLLVGSTAQSFTLLAEEMSEEKTPIRNSRSVAEMLDEEFVAFDAESEFVAFNAEFDKAQALLDAKDGEQI